MRKLAGGLGLGAVLLIFGCNPLFDTRDRERKDVRKVAEPPTVDQLVDFLNKNADRVEGKAVRCERVSIDAKQGHEPAPGLLGTLICQTPRNFRLTGKAMGRPAVDIGSNSDEFWYWISEAKPPYVYHCSYQDLATGNVKLPFPFQPDIIVAALGVSRYDPNKRYDLKVNPRTAELSELIRSPDGKEVRKITVFDRAWAYPERGEPQVIAHSLQDERGKTICTATISAVQVDAATGAVLPKKVKLVWPAQQIEMAMELDNAVVVSLTGAQADKYFSRSNLSDKKAFDLARDVMTPTGRVQQVGATNLR
jgi:hypothetical protein